MPCYTPLHAYEGPETLEGKVATVWRRSQSPDQIERVLPCGKCIGCRLQYSKSWAMRCMDEAQMYERNCMLTLTYDDEHLPEDGSLDVGVFQNFMKRLRKAYGSGIRYFHCGEYGGRLGRPHYHALLFNHDFDDKVLYSVRNGNQVFTSKALDQIWQNGFSLIGSVTFASAAYVARYVTKKATDSDNRETFVDESTGRRMLVDKVTGVVKADEYVTMSRGCKKLGTGGIGYDWYRKYRSDVYPEDFKVVNGSKCRPPRFYDNLLDKDDPELLDILKIRRKDNSPSYEERSDRRLLVKQEVKLAQIKSLRRSLE